MEEYRDDLESQAGLKNIEQIAVLMDAILPKKISYVLLKCGTLVMIKKERMNEDSIFDSFENWDYPEHRFNVPEDLRQVQQRNQEYLSHFMNSSDHSETEKKFFQLGLRYMQKCGYAYPGGERADRNVDTPLPVAGICSHFNLGSVQFAGHRELVFCSWPACPGMFNHYLTLNSDPPMNLQTANVVLSDLHRYDFIFPRFHSIRIGEDEKDEDEKDEDADVDDK